MRNRKALCVVLAATLVGTVSVSAQERPDMWRLPPINSVPESETVAPNATPTGPDLDSAVGTGLSQEQVAAVEAEVLTELEEESTWYDWVVPSHWSLPPVWESSFQLGVDGSEGNASTLTFRSGANLRRKLDWSDLKLALSYVKSMAEEVETKHNAQLEANHDWLFGDSPWSVYAKTILVYDEFRPFDLELTLNGGLGYQFVKTDALAFKGRFGSGATRQWDGPNESWRPEAMLGVDFEYKISDRQKLRATSDYYPEWGEFDMYRIRTDAGWEVLLDEATNMSLKLGVIDRYDSNAGGTKPNALDYSLLLLWKL